MTIVDRFTQCLARLEVRHPFLGDGHTFAAARIAPHAGRSPVDRKAAETADLDPMSSHQGVIHRVQDGLDGELGVAMGELAKPIGQFFNKVRTGHEAE